MQKNDESDKKQEKIRTPLQTVALVSGLGLHLAAVVAVCIYLGKKADEAWGTAPYGILSGILLGFPVAIYSIYKKIVENL